MTCDSQVLPLADPPLPATCKMSPGYQTRAGRKGSSHILPGAGSAFAAVLKRKSGRVKKHVLGDKQSRANKNIPSCCVATLSFQEPWVIKEAKLETTEADIVDRCRHTNVAYRTGSVPASCSSVPCQKHPETILSNLVETVLLTSNGNGKKCACSMTSQYFQEISLIRRCLDILGPSWRACFDFGF